MGNERGEGGEEQGSSMGLWGLMAIGVGGMVGGGIFSVLGLASTLAGGATPIAFAMAGLVALLTAYAYVKLSVTYPGQGGTVIFLDRVFGVNLLTGAMNTLLWLSYIITLSLYASGFASYLGQITHLESTLWEHVLISVGILIPTGLNVLSASLVSKAETYVVVIKLLILIAVIGFGVTSVDMSRLAVESWGAPVQIIGSGMIVFVAYEGFELMANAVSDVKDYKRVVPRAFYGAVGFVLALYVLTAGVTVGSLSPEEIKQAADFALAKAAQPSMGQIGFTLVGVAAVLATFSALNATLYGSARLAYTLATEDEMPDFLKKKLWNQPIMGLVLTALAALGLANSVDIESISMMASAGFLIVFAVVNMACYAAHEEIGSERVIAALGVLGCLFSLGMLLWHTFQSSASQLWFLGGMLGIVLVVEVLNMKVYGHHKTSRRRREVDAEGE